MKIENETRLLNHTHLTSNLLKVQITSQHLKNSTVQCVFQNQLVTS